MKESHLQCVISEKKDKLICSTKEEVDPETGRLEPYGEKKSVPLKNLSRVMVETNQKLTGTKHGQDISYHEKTKPRPKHNLPTICYEEGSEGGKKCGTKAPEWALISTASYLKEIQKHKPRIIDYLIDNNVRITYGEDLGKTEEGREKLGTASCGRKHRPNEIQINRYGPHPKQTLLHEIAHCKEGIERKKKGEKPIQKARGKWKEKKGELVGTGKEKRAEKFVKRMKKKGI